VCACVHVHMFVCVCVCVYESFCLAPSLCVRVCTSVRV